MNRRWTLGAASLFACVALSSLGYACSTSSDTPSSACTSLVTCCSSVPAAEQASCVGVAGSEDESTCANVLSTYSAANVCGGLPDGGSSGGGSCVSLSACCKSVPSVEQESCNSVVSLGVASSCATALTALQQSGSCGGGGGIAVDGGAPSFTGPSCPAGSPPQSFVGADASADCVKCANNCLATEGFSSDCAQYYSCYCPCAENDTGCQEACMPLADDCPDTVSDVQSCIMSDCASLCTQLSADPIGCVPTTDAGTGVCELAVLGDAGAGISCGSLGLQPGTCPSSNLVGCCSRSIEDGLSAVEVACYYDSSQSGQAQDDCQNMAGAWSTTLP